MPPPRLLTLSGHISEPTGPILIKFSALNVIGVGDTQLVWLKSDKDRALFCASVPGASFQRNMVYSNLGLLAHFCQCPFMCAEYSLFCSQWLRIAQVWRRINNWPKLVKMVLTKSNYHILPDYCLMAVANLAAGLVMQSTEFLSLIFVYYYVTAAQYMKITWKVQVVIVITLRDCPHLAYPVLQLEGGGGQ